MILCMDIALELLLHNFSALVVKHSLMRSFLKPLAFIFVHLLSFDEAWTSTDSSVSFGLVDFIAFFVICFFYKLAFAD